MKNLADEYLANLCFVKRKFCFYYVSLKHLKPTAPDNMVSQCQFLKKNCRIPLGGCQMTLQQAHCK